MKKIIYNKLVRDNIPEIIRNSGKECDIEILSDEEYLQMVDAKLDEELAEYHKEQNLEELADLLEVLYAAADARGYSVEELEACRIKKQKERGGFEKRILLKEVKNIKNKIFSPHLKLFPGFIRIISERDRQSHNESLDRTDGMRR